MADNLLMTTTRLEAFSDGVLAIIITVMVLELKVPKGNDLAALRHTTGTGPLIYLLSSSMSASTGTTTTTFSRLS